MTVLNSCEEYRLLCNPYFGTQATDFCFDSNLRVDLQQPSTFPVNYGSPAELDVVEAFKLS
jgi:hypothetical protein